MTKPSTPNILIQYTKWILKWISIIILFLTSSYIIKHTLETKTQPTISLSCVVEESQIENLDPGQKIYLDVRSNLYGEIKSVTLLHKTNFGNQWVESPTYYKHYLHQWDSYTFVWKSDLFLNINRRDLRVTLTTTTIQGRWDCKKITYEEYNNKKPLTPKTKPFIF